MKLPAFLRRILGEPDPSPVLSPVTTEPIPSPPPSTTPGPVTPVPSRPANPSQIPLGPALAALINNPKLLPDPVFPKEGYLQAFARGFFQHLLRESKRESAIERIQVTKNDRHMTSLLADGFGFWAIDLEAISDRGVLGKDEFAGRVREPIRRPPPELAAVAVEQHILDRGVARIQINDGPILPGGAQVCSLKTIGWYVATLMVPKRVP